MSELAMVCAVSALVLLQITGLMKNENFTGMLLKHVWIALGLSTFFIGETSQNFFWLARQNFVTKLLLMSFKCW